MYNSYPFYVFHNKEYYPSIHKEMQTIFMLLIAMISFMILWIVESSLDTLYQDHFYVVKID